MENETASYIKVICTFILVIIFGAFVFSVGVFLLGTSPQAGAIITPLLGGVIIYSFVWFFINYPHLFRHIKAGPGGFEADLQEAKDEATEIKAEETVVVKTKAAEATIGGGAAEAAVIKAEEAASEAKEEINKIQESDTSALGVFLQLANEIEIKLRIISELNGRSAYKYAPMARYARDLAEENIISAQLAHLIEDFRSVRNKVIHSTRDISRSQLDDAIYISNVILTELNKIIY